MLLYLESRLLLRKTISFSPAATFLDRPMSLLPKRFVRYLIFLFTWSSVSGVLILVIMVQYLDMYKMSIEDPAGFWSDIASQFYWKQRWGQPVYSENLDIRKGRIKIEVNVYFHNISFSNSCPTFSFVFGLIGRIEILRTRTVVQRWYDQHLLQLSRQKYWVRKWRKDRSFLGRKWTRWRW